MAGDVQAEELLTLSQVRDSFEIKERTLYGWLRAAKIQPVLVDGCKFSRLLRAMSNLLRRCFVLIAPLLSFKQNRACSY